MNITAQDTGLSLPPGRSVGLLGGSFDPPHAGHLGISREALRRFGLDRVVWLVSPGNPLKHHGPAPLETRMEAARALVDHPRITVSDAEAQLGSAFTAETIASLQALFPRVRFVWLMGADNLRQFHLWQNWHDILGRVPVGVLARPGDRISARRSVTARIYADARLPSRESRRLSQMTTPAWCFVNVPMTDLSSSEIRARGAWQATKDARRT